MVFPVKGMILWGMYKLPQKSRGKSRIFRECRGMGSMLLIAAILMGACWWGIWQASEELL